jgi:hypothetical protein
VARVEASAPIPGDCTAASGGFIAGIVVCECGGEVTASGSCRTSAARNGLPSGRPAKNDACQKRHEIHVVSGNHRRSRFAARRPGHTRTRHFSRRPSLSPIASPCASITTRAAGRNSCNTRRFGGDTPLSASARQHCDENASCKRASEHAQRIAFSHSFEFRGERRDLL